MHTCILHIHTFLTVTFQVNPLPSLTFLLHLFLTGNLYIHSGQTKTFHILFITRLPSYSQMHALSYRKINLHIMLDLVIQSSSSSVSSTCLTNLPFLIIKLTRYNVQTMNRLSSACLMEQIQSKCKNISTAHIHWDGNWNFKVWLHIQKYLHCYMEFQHLA